MRRFDIASNTYGEIASGNLNATDTSITNAVVDNSVYGYHIYTSTFDADDEVWGALITYTL